MKKLFDEIYIHAGLPKTGSSFLQSSLEFLEAKGALKETTYPEPHPDDDFQFIRSGNGLEIAKSLTESLTPDFDESKLKVAFECLLDKRSCNRDNLLISSEWFSNASPDRFVYFREEMLKVCNRIKVIIFIRPFAPWAWSLYNQRIKRHNLSISFEEWSDIYLVKDFGRLMDNIFGFNLTIKSLLFNKNDLLPLLLNELSEDKEIFNLVPNETVNRSLTEIENNLIKIANEVFNDSHLSTRISDLLIKEMPFNDAMPLSSGRAKYVEQYLPEVLNNLDKYNIDAAKKIKEQLSSGYNLIDYSDRLNYKKKDVHENVKLILTAVFEYYSQSDRRLSSLMSCSDKLKKDRVRFDPMHYLLLNPDVLDANVDPVNHFKEFGKEEKRYTCFVVD